MTPVAEISARSAFRSSTRGDFAVRRPTLKVGEHVFHGANRAMRSRSLGLRASAAVQETAATVTMNEQIGLQIRNRQ